MYNLFVNFCVYLVILVGLAGVLIICANLWITALEKILQAKDLTNDFKEFWAKKHYK